MIVHVQSPYPICFHGVPHSYYGMNHEDGMHLYRMYLDYKRDMLRFVSQLQITYDEYADTMIDREEPPLSVYWRYRRYGSYQFETFWYGHPLTRFGNIPNHAFRTLEGYGVIHYTLNDLGFWVRRSVSQSWDGALNQARQLGDSA